MAAPDVLKADAAPAPSQGGPSLTALWNNKEARSVIFQVLTIVGLIAFFAFIVTNAIANLAAIGKTFGFDFLYEPAGYNINQRLIEYTSQDYHLRAGLVGLLNTLVVAAAGIVLATIVGFVMGVIRLSPNWLLSRMVYCFIEFTRNVPVLLHILLVYGVIINVLPRPREAFNVADAFYFSNRGFIVPEPQGGDLLWLTGVAFLVAVAAVVMFRRWAHRVQEATGRIYPVFWISVGILVGLPGIVFLVTGAPITWDVPELGRFNFKGGMVLLPEFLALWLALSLYTAAFIAENVRAGILAINKGQWEAASALGLPRKRVMSLIIIPQALRVIVPPLTSQYLNLTKNSSLAIAIGYEDIVATIGGVSLMQTGREMETMIIVIGIYLTFSLTISLVMNWYNKRIKLVER